MTSTTDLTTESWVYVKLYLGRAIDRMDRLLIDLGTEPVLRERARRWFFLRYVDERGIHVRLRAQARPDDRAGLSRALIDACAQRLSELHGHPPGEYSPMVSMPGFEAGLDRITAAHHDVDVIEARYERETDKYGERPAMDIAERVFHESSQLAWTVLRDEEAGRLSRKDLVPILMHEACQAFIAPQDQPEFWNEYSYYWLNGRSPAAEDWQQRFADKDAELQQRGIPVVAALEQLSPAARGVVNEWSRCLRAAVEDYAGVGHPVEAKAEVLCFNFVHLMNNRLGQAALEEAYMAALLERRCRREKAEAL